MGRPVGSTNENSKAVKNMIRSALERVGGVEYFMRQAEKNPTAFMSLIGKTIPPDVNNNIQISIFDKYALAEANPQNLIEHSGQTSEDI